jgi:hypothetical protein
MEQHQANKDHDSLAERKAELMREGELYRARMLQYKAQVKHDARPEVMFHSAIDHATWALRARVDGLLRPTGVNVSSLAPYALTVVSFLRRRGLVKPALGIAAVLGGVALYVQHKRTQQLEY